MSWISPTGFVDPDSKWTDEALAYDEDTATYAVHSAVSPGAWSSFIELTHSAIICTKVRFWARYLGSDEGLMDIDAYYGGVWNHVFEGTYLHNQWSPDKSLSSAQTITAFRFRNKNVGSTLSHAPYLMEVDFWQFVVPTVTTQAVTDILSITATGNGNITDTSGEIVSKRGICWNTTGSPTVADNKVEETGDFSTGAFTGAMTGLSPGIHYYVKAYAYNPAGYGYGGEVEFDTDKVAPTVTIQTPTVILPTTVTANGNITASGGENATVRGFKYGLTKTDTWSASDSGSFPVGAYTKGLTGLAANTTYWIRAYATNSIGTGYSDWIEFQTAASGTIPTGTNLFIAADLSGYSYQLMKAETDDGFTFTGYFVISTDLTNKQGLAFYKRILDLHLYFRSESSGTATIYVKRDNEASWQTVGTVSLTGTADIIIPHLAPDIRGKHFLFKISATNFFRCLGVLFEYLPEDLR